MIHHWSKSHYAVHDCRCICKKVFLKWGCDICVYKCVCVYIYLCMYMYIDLQFAAFHIPIYHRMLSFSIHTNLLFFVALCVCVCLCLNCHVKDCHGILICEITFFKIRVVISFTYLEELFNLQSNTSKMGVAFRTT